jgi:GT2 family glycosyltransferase
VGTAVSVVIPTFNRLARLRHTLTALAAQEGVGEPVEVIVVSDGSTDGTDEYLSSGDVPLPVVGLRQENAGPAAARNRGVARATGEVVLFIDDDVVPTAGLVAAHLRRHEGGDDLVVIGPMRTPDDHDISPWVRWEQDMLYKQYDAMERGDWEPTARQFYTGNASTPRRHLDAAGGFDTSFRRAEDVELAYRLADRGLQFVYDPSAVVLHYAERSFDAWLDVASSYGRNDVIFATERGQPWLLDTIATEFHGRNRLIRELTRASLPRPRLRRAATSTLSLVARHAPARAARPALSAVYNLAYYSGMADQLGSPGSLLDRFDAAVPT